MNKSASQTSAAKAASIAASATKQRLAHQNSRHHGVGERSAAQRRATRQLLSSERIVRGMHLSEIEAAASPSSPEKLGEGGKYQNGSKYRHGVTKRQLFFKKRRQRAMEGKAKCLREYKYLGSMAASYISKTYHERRRAAKHENGRLPASSCSWRPLFIFFYLEKQKYGRRQKKLKGVKYICVLRLRPRRRLAAKSS